MVKKKMFIKNGSVFHQIDLVIDDTDLASWKSLMDYYPIWDKIKKENMVGFSAEDYAEIFGFDVKKDAWVVSKLLGNILYEDNPLVISDSIKKLYEYVPTNDIEKSIVENLFKRLSYKASDIKMKPKCSIMNEVAGLNYCLDSEMFDSMLDEMIDNEIECNPDISKKKVKKLRVNVKSSIPRKSILF